MPVGLSPDRVVLILVTTTDGRPLRSGTGTLIAENRVLTALHVVEKKPAAAFPGPLQARKVEQEELWVRRHGTKETLRARVLEWRHPAKLDVVLLEVAPLKVEGHPRSLLLARELEAGLPWEAQGYPLVTENNQKIDLEPVRGATCSFKTGHKEIKLDIEARPDLIHGLSGAAVVVGGKIVGVMRAKMGGWDGQRVVATPVADFLGDPGFREAIGLAEEDEKDARALESLRVRLSELLRKSSSIEDRLAKALDVRGSGGTEQVVEAMLGAEAIKIARLLNECHDDTRGQERRIVRDIFDRVLPFAGDWNAVRRMVKADIGRQKSSFVLPLRHGTIAELVMAGAEGRPMELLPTGKGVGQFSVPASWRAPTFRARKSDLLKAFVDTFVNRLEDETGRLASVWRELRIRYKDPDELKKRLRSKLEYYLTTTTSDRLPHYLLLVDKELDVPGEAPELWGIIQETLGDEVSGFPHLRLVRLTGDEKEFNAEIGFLEHVEAVLSR